MTPKQIAKVLDELGLCYEHGPEGFTLDNGYAVCVTNESSGRGGTWFKWHLPSNQRDSRLIKNRASLIRVLTR